MPLKVKMLHSSLNQLLDCCEPHFVPSILKYPDVLQREDIIMVFIVLCSQYHSINHIHPGTLAYLVSLRLDLRVCT